MWILGGGETDLEMEKVGEEVDRCVKRRDMAQTERKGCRSRGYEMNGSGSARQAVRIQCT
jgi:hypothetical protein